MKEVAIKAMSQREREDAVNEVRILASVSHSMVIRFQSTQPLINCLGLHASHTVVHYDTIC